MVDAPCGRFSGGEKSRLALALMIRTAPNLLLLDEPTNHLDLEMREALTMALQEAEAGVVVVSHDRHLLRACCDELWLVANGKVVPFDGDLDDYAEWLAKERSEDKKSVQDKASAKKDDELAQLVLATQGGRQAGSDPQRLRRQSADSPAQQALKRDADKLEKKLVAYQGEANLVAQQLADPALYVTPNSPRLLALTQRQSQLKRQIEETEGLWMEVQELMEAT